MLKKVPYTNSYSPTNIKKYLKGKKRVFDIGSGSSGSYWWRWLGKETFITGIDLYFFPKKIPNNVKLYNFDASKLSKITKGIKVKRYKKNIFKKFTSEVVDWENKYDMVVANHVLEHVSSYEDTIKGIAKICKKGAMVYTGFPDANNFTDIFYHLIHPEGGGHIQKLTRDNIYKEFKKNGFKLLECNVWPDDWLWFEKTFDYKEREVKFVNQKDISYAAELFRKELTPKKGYFYGWEMVFEKIVYSN